MYEQYIPTVKNFRYYRYNKIKVFSILSYFFLTSVFIDNHFVSHAYVCGHIYILSYVCSLFLKYI